MAAFEIPPEQPDYTAFRKACKRHHINPDKIDSIPVIDPSKSPYREELEKLGASLPSWSIVRPTKQWYTLSARHRVSRDVVYNDGAANDTYQMSWLDSTTITNSISVSASVDVTIQKIVKVGMSVTYSHSWAETQAHGEAFTITVPPGHFGWIERATLISNIEGDFIMANTLEGPEDGTTFGDPSKAFRWSSSYSGPAMVADATGLLVGVTRKGSPEEIEKYKQDHPTKTAGNLTVFTEEGFYLPLLLDGGEPNEVILEPPPRALDGP
ncbi:hypothetical protein ACIQWA_17835 [Kitasatospora sp. NPDC098652]|uniref:hypothetical protein n=1 Tax=Kitasatospora sp. NPDC098652 TaxID=3364095 RepID=UPI00380C1B9D